MASVIRRMGVILGLGLLAACAGPVEKGRALLVQQAAADAAYAQGDCETAVVQYRGLADQLKDKSQALLRLGNCLARLQRWEESKSAYLEAVTADPGFVKAWYNLSYLQAQTLARTVAGMSANIDPTDPAAARMRLLAEQIMAAFRASQASTTDREMAPTTSPAHEPEMQSLPDGDINE